MSEETNESRGDRRQRIIDRIIADRQALRGENAPSPELETPAGITIDLNEINLNDIAMLDPVSERKWRQVGFGTEGETMVPPPADE